MARVARALALVLGLSATATAVAQACVVDPGGRESVAWVGAVCVEGSAEDTARRTFLFEASAGERVGVLTATSVPAVRLDLCVEGIGPSHCRSGEGTVELPGLVLPEGEVTVTLMARLGEGGSYRVSFDDLGPALPGHEREPNDAVQVATVLGPDLTARGRLAGREQDYFRVDVTGEPQLWRVQVVGAGVAALRYHDAGGRVLQQRSAESGGRGVRMSNLLLLPGPHWFSLDGTDADYALRLIPLGPAGPDATTATGVPASEDAGATATVPSSPLGPPMTPASPPPAADVEVPRPTGPPPPGILEREPNDDVSRAHLLRPGEPWVGLLAEAGDRDVYRFYLGEEGYVRLTVTPAEDGAIEANATGRFSTPGVGEPYRADLYLLAGDHIVTLRPSVVSDGYYQILLEWLDPWLLPADLEPNDAPHQARPLPADLEASGVVGTNGDADWYLIPAVSRDTEVVVELDAEGARIGALRDPETNRVVASLALDRATGQRSAVLPAGGPYALEVTGQGAYHLRVAFGPGGPEPLSRREAPELAVELSGAMTIAAYHPLGQRVPLEVELRNPGPEALDLELEAHLSDHGWRATWGERRLTLAPGASRRVPLLLEVAPGARGDLGVRVTVGVRWLDGGGDRVIASAATELAAVCGAPAVGPQRAWAVPDALLGGLNLAWTGLGAAPGTEARRELLLYDGLTPPAGGWEAPLGGATTVRLAGDAVPLVRGVLLHPLGSGDAGSKLADFRIGTSLDGVAFTTVFEGRMRSPQVEQGFVFDAPVEARYVRLEVLSRQDGQRRNPVHLGQFKVIAEPGSSPFASPIDLARREVGGHVVVSAPHLGSYALNAADPRPHTARLAAGQEVASWVIGLHHGRAARIAALGWTPHAAGDPARRIAEVQVAVSLDGPLGPWSELGTWRPHDRPNWELPEPVWARYVRFEAGGYADRPTIEFPDTLSLLEHPVGPDHRSALAEWGHYGRAAGFEWGAAELEGTASLDGAPHDGAPHGGAPPSGGTHGSAAAAAPLVDGVPTEARVLIGEYEAWFAVDVPPGTNHLRLELSGDATIAYRYELMDASGAAVLAEARVAHDAVVLEAFVEPGRYLLRTFEPERSVVFAWDNSGSMGPYLDAVYQAVASFARELRSDREAVQLLAFAVQPRFLMPDWSGDPTTVLGALLAYDRGDGSSDAEVNLAFAVEELGARDGTRAVLLLTDAESGASASSVARLWPALTAVQPRVFTFETSTSSSDDTQDRMQDWANLAGGAYDHSRTMGDLDVGLARVACLLRQPKAVRVTLRVEAREPPGPGSLAVRRAEAAEALRPALLVIFDASGSMGKLLPDGRTSRLEAARGVLAHLVDDVLDEGVPFALRAYGHVRPTACDTRLELPLAPLDRAAARRAVAAIDAKLLSGTPLAASIEAAAADLAAATGPTSIVLITDGEESCGGDPAAAIRALVASRPGVRVSIVGFDLDADDPAAARARFTAWAELGGGTYLEARDAAALADAVVAQLRPAELRFDVLDRAGAVVASGLVDGDAVPVPAGRYRLRVGDDAGADQVEVAVQPDRVTTFVLAEGP